jgi:hypothetical protein
MRVMIIRKADAETEAGAMPSAELATAMMTYMQRMADAGVLIDMGNGLKPSAKGARVTFNKGKPLVLDGPFIETKELIAGYALLEVGSLEEAIAWVNDWPCLDGDGNATIEIRPLWEVADFGDAFSPELTEKHDSMKARA